MPTLRSVLYFLQVQTLFVGRTVRSGLCGQVFKSHFLKLSRDWKTNQRVCSQDCSGGIETAVRIQIQFRDSRLRSLLSRYSIYAVSNHLREPSMQSDNAWALYNYQHHMQEAQGLDRKTIDARMRHVLQFNAELEGKLFRLISKNDIRRFKSRLIETDQEGGDERTKKAAATIVQTCRNLKHFLDWLLKQKSYRSMDRTLPDFCKPPNRQVALSKVKKEKHVPTIGEILTLLSSMPTMTTCQRRDRAIVAFLVLTGVRDGALVSLRLKHIDLENRRVLQDANEVNTKASKTITVFWFPVDEVFQKIVIEWVLERRALATSEEEPLFPRSPSAVPEHTPEDCFWTTAAPVRKILKTATKGAGVTYFVPHSVRSTLARQFDQISRTWEERKALSQNLGHEHIRTTEEHYGKLDLDRQRELIEGLHNRTGQNELEKLFKQFANANAERREMAIKVLELK